MNENEYSDFEHGIDLRQEHDERQRERGGDYAPMHAAPFNSESDPYAPPCPSLRRWTPRIVPYTFQAEDFSDVPF